MPFADEAVPPPGDAELITLVRAGHRAAFADLYSRHVAAAGALARQFARSPSEADDLVSEAFARILDGLLAGRGPDLAFRAYLFTTLRNTAYDRTRKDRPLRFTDDISAHDEPGPVVDPVLAEFENGLVGRAFAALPERWQTVLWHTQVEGQSAAEVGLLLGMAPNAVSSLAFRAREGLREAYLQAHLADTGANRCRMTVERLGAWTRGALSKRETAEVETHLAECDRCRALAAELSQINSSLRALLAPLLLGGVAVGYLAGLPPVAPLVQLGALAGGKAAAAGKVAATAGGKAAATGKAGTAVGAAAGPAGSARTTGQWAAIAAGAAVAAGLVIWVVVAFTGPGPGSAPPNLGAAFTGSTSEAPVDPPRTFGSEQTNLAGNAPSPPIRPPVTSRPATSRPAVSGPAISRLATPRAASRPVATQLALGQPPGPADRTFSGDLPPTFEVPTAATAPDPGTSNPSVGTTATPPPRVRASPPPSSIPPTSTQPTSSPAPTTTRVAGTSRSIPPTRATSTPSTRPTPTGSPSPTTGATNGPSPVTPPTPTGIPPTPPRLIVVPDTLRRRLIGGGVESLSLTVANQGQMASTRETMVISGPVGLSAAGSTPQIPGDGMRSGPEFASRIFGTQEFGSASLLPVVEPGCGAPQPVGDSGRVSISCALPPIAAGGRIAVLVRLAVPPATSHATVTVTIAGSTYTAPGGDRCNRPAAGRPPWR